MKRLLLSVLSALAFFILGWILSSFFVPVLIDFIVPRQSSVSLAITLPTTPFEIYMAFGLLLAAWGVIIVVCTRRRWRTVLISIAAGVLVAMLGMGVQRLIIGAVIQSQRELLHQNPVVVTLEELHLARTLMLGGLTSCFIGFLLQQFQRRRAAEGSVQSAAAITPASE